MSALLPIVRARTAPGRTRRELQLLNALWSTLPDELRIHNPGAIMALIEQWQPEHLDELDQAITRAEVVADALEGPVTLYISWYESADGKFRMPIFESHTEQRTDSQPPEHWDEGPLHITVNGCTEVHRFDWSRLDADS